MRRGNPYIQGAVSIAINSIESKLSSIIDSMSKNNAGIVISFSDYSHLRQSSVCRELHAEGRMIEKKKDGEEEIKIVEGGVGFPEVGLSEGTRKGGVGIMQLYIPMPTAAQTWNWKKNIKGGLTLIEKKRTEAKTLPVTELGRLNDERKANGLPLCKGLPNLR